MGEELAGLVNQHGYWVVGAIIFLESMGLPLPGESLLVGAAIYAAAQGGLNIEWIVLASAIGAVMGDNAGYLLGRWGGAPALRRWGPKIGLTEQRQLLGRYLFDRHGPKVVFFGRFTAILRTFAALLAGATGMAWGRFLIWNGLGGVAWTSLYGFGAYGLGSQIHTVLGPFGLVVGGVALAVIVWSWRFIRRHEARLVQQAAVAMGEAGSRPRPRRVGRLGSGLQPGRDPG